MQLNGRGNEHAGFCDEHEDEKHEYFARSLMNCEDPQCEDRIGKTSEDTLSHII